MADRYAFQTAVRAAAVELLDAYKTASGDPLQIYRARPTSVNPPTAFVDRMLERIEYTTHLFQRYVRCELIVLHGTFDSGGVADQRDAFVDAFMELPIDDIHVAGSNTTLAVIGVEDVPVYVNDWMKPELQRAYYATRIVLEGFAGGA